MQVRPVTDKECISKVILNILGKGEFTEKELAEKLGVSRNTIGNYVNASSAPSMRVIRALHDTFHLSYESIFGEEEMDVTFIKYSSLPQDEQQLINVLIEKLSSSSKG